MVGGCGVGGCGAGAVGVCGALDSGLLTGVVSGTSSMYDSSRVMGPRPVPGASKDCLGGWVSTERSCCHKGLADHRDDVGS